MEFLLRQISNIEKDYGESTLTVKEVLSISEFKDYKILAGEKGLSRKCKHLTILETPEGVEWLQGEEFLLSAGYALNDRMNEIDTIIERGFLRNVAAIAFKEGRYLKEFTQKMIDDANKYNMPLISLPYDLIYSNAVSKFYERLFYKKNEYILKAREVHEKLFEMVFENKDLGELIETLSKLTDSSIIIFDDSLSMLSSVFYKDIHEYAFHEILSHKELIFENKKIANKYYSTKFGNIYINLSVINNKNNIKAYVLAISEECLNNLSREAIDRGIKLLSLKMTNEENKIFQDIKIKKAVTEMILNNEGLPEEFFYNIKDSLGWNKKGQHFVSTCFHIINKSSDKELINIFKEKFVIVLKKVFHNEDFLITEDVDKIYVFFSSSSIISLDSFVNSMIDSLKFYGKKVKLLIGISKGYSNIKDMPRMYKESYIATIFSRERNICYYEELDTIKLLYPLTDDKQAIEHYNNTIRPLKEYDKENNTELLYTLKTYFECNMNKKSTAERLYIHGETLRYRLNKTEKITGYYLNTSEGIFALQMSLKLWCLRTMHE